MNGKTQEINLNGAIILQSATVPGDEYTAPLSVVLLTWKWNGDGFAVRYRNEQDGGEFEGFYTDSPIAAIREYARRCEAIGADPFPPSWRRRVFAAGLAICG